MPCGQKNRSSEMIQSQTVTPPLAAIEGTTFKLNTATTNSSTRSKRPRTRFKRGWLSSVVDIVKVTKKSDNLIKSGHRFQIARCPDGEMTRSDSVCCHRSHPLVLRSGQRHRDIGKCRQVLVDVSLGMLHRNRPLLIPPVRLAHRSAIHHAKPVMPPQVNVKRQPVAVVTNLLRIQHQRSIRPSTRDIPLQPNFRNGLLISIHQLVTKGFDPRVVSASKHFAESCDPRRHRNRIRVVSAAMKNFVV